MTQHPITRDDYEVEISIRGPDGSRVGQRITVYSWSNVQREEFLSEFDHSLVRLGRQAMKFFND